MKPITAYIYYRYGNKMDLPFTQNEVIAKINEQLKEPFPPDRFHCIFEGIAKPKTVHIARELARLGYSPKTIQEWMQLSQSTVSIHLNKQNVLEYRNHHFHDYNFQTIKGVQQFYKNGSNYGKNS
jgi:hypothetical protein